MQQSRTIRIFLASSITELKDERNKLSNYFAGDDVRNMFRHDSIDIQLVRCEDFFSGNTGLRSQDVLNQLLKGCDISLFLFKTKAGKRTIEEFDIAKMLQDQEIYVYCSDIPKEIRSSRLNSFINRLDKEGTDWKTFTHVSEVESQLIVELIKHERKLLVSLGESFEESEKNRKFRTALERVEKNGDAHFGRYVWNEKHQQQLQLDIHRDIEDLMSRIGSVMENISEPIAARINRTVDLYKKADHWASATNYDNEKYCDLLFDYAQFLFNYGLYNESEQVFLCQLSLAGKTYDYRNKKIVISFNSIGRVYWEQSNYKEAKKYFVKALEMDSNCNMEDEETARIYNNLGSVYWKQGYYQKALKQFKHALRIRITVFGMNHSDTAESYNDIGLLYDDLAKFHDALDSLNQSLKIMETISDAKKTDIATVYANIGFVYMHMKKYDKALRFCNKSLKIKKETLGEKHPDTATVYHNVGKIYAEQEKYKEAIKYYKKAMRIDEEVLGENHPDTATDYNSLGVVYIRNEEYEKALEYLDKALEIRLRKLTPKHHCVIETQGLIEKVIAAMKNDKGADLSK